MKQLIIITMLAAASFSTYAQNPQRETNPLAKYMDIATPDYRGREFVLGQIGVRSKVSLGCDGNLNGAVFNNLAADINGAINHIRSNIGGFLVNAIAYSNPTLYQILEDVNKSFQALRGMNIGTCSSIRNMAESSRKQKEERAVAECMSDGKTSTECNQGSMLERFLPDVYQKIDQQLSGLTGKQTFTMRDFYEKVAGIDGGTGGSPLAGGIRNDPGSQQVRDDIESLMGDGSIDPNVVGAQSGLDWQPRASSVAELMADRESDYAFWIDDITGPGAAGAGDLSLSSYYDRLQSNPAFGMLSDETLGRLAELREDKPWIYESVRDAMAREMSQAYLSYIISWMRSIVRTAESGAAGSEIEDNAAELLQKTRENLSLAEAELEIIRTRNENTDRLGDLERFVNRLQ